MGLTSLLRILLPTRIIRDGYREAGDVFFAAKNRRTFSI
ncbi:hypothetical protein KKC1_25540 [Calderihabitans maritimus]|uniref:Uncharacterized protein n=1 Tax=Calderihabitans maritimus TaxID=1246530 RepID=A0A1Z5HVX3_9FIRM|nr:hypothetical protein KKC1_25540 [Calderihabitans maritimus]